MPIKYVVEPQQAVGGAGPSLYLVSKGDKSRPVFPGYRQCLGKLQRRGL